MPSPFLQILLTDTQLGDDSTVTVDVLSGQIVSVYKQLENKQTAVKSLFGPEVAQRIVFDAIAAYRDAFQ